MSAKTIKQILASAPELRPLTEQSRRLLHLQQLLRAALPVGVAPQVAVGGFASGILTIVSSNGAAAARLRQIKPRLLKQLQRDERELNSIRILMQVSPHHNPLHKKKIFLDHTARSALLTLSSRLESSSLRSALIQLANRGATSNPKQETLEEVDSYKNQSNNNSDA